MNFSIIEGDTTDWGVLLSDFRNEKPEDTIRRR